MNFFDCIYICAYIAYRDYDPRWEFYGAKAKATYLLTLCMISLSIAFFLIINTFYKIHLTNFIDEHLNITLVMTFIAVFFIQSLISKYYPQEKIDRLVEIFETKYLVERQMWGWIAGITIVVPIIFLALTNKGS